MDVNRLRIVWNGLPGGTGLTTFYYRGTPDIDSIVDWFTAIGQQIPNNVTFAIPNGGDTIDDSTGQITGGWSAPGVGVSVQAQNASTFAGPTGAVIDWLTGGIVNGRRVKGRTFIVPLCVDQYDDNGSLTQASINALATATNDMLALEPTMCVLSQPFVPALGDQRPPRLGSSHLVTGFQVPDLAAVLRSRRS